MSRKSAMHIRTERIMGRRLLPLGLLLLAACATGRSADAGRHVEVAREPSATGSVSEEEFKAMHTLRADSPPPRQGQMVEVAGTQSYLSLPKGAQGPVPGIVVIHEWWGLNEHIKHWADRLASEGYAALAVDLFGGKVATTPEEAMALTKAVDPARASEILTTAHAFLEQDPRVRAPRTGVVGWCFGGRWSLRTAIAIPDLEAAVIYYGNPTTDPRELATIKARVLGIFGTRDKSIPPETVGAFGKALEEAGVSHRILSFEAEHAFANPSGGRYDERAAAAAWSEVSAFLASNLKR